MRAQHIQRLAGVLSIALIATLYSVSASSRQDKGAAIDAEKIFMRECKDCHGEDGRGRMQGQPDFTNPKWQANVTDVLLFKVIKFGREPMPFYLGALSDDEITALVKYIRSLAPAKSGSESPNNSQPPATTTTAANGCLTCHQQSGDQSVALYARSVHARNGFACNDCHGGDATAHDKAAAHATNFVGKPSPVEQLAMCGKCHQQPLADFNTSLHRPKNLSAPRLVCSDCHGAHTVGSPARDFKFAGFCTNCHGLEYLPELPADFRKLLQIADEENSLINHFRVWGQTPPGDVLAKRKAIRGMIGALVHKTDLRHGIERAPEITGLNDEFKQMTGTRKK
jgi:mono/diheme cytochrome c family protein